MTRPINEEESDCLIGGLYEAVHPSGGGGDLREGEGEGGREGEEEETERGAHELAGSTRKRRGI